VGGPKPETLNSGQRQGAGAGARTDKRHAKNDVPVHGP
jgi:hypothetical protein